MEITSNEITPSFLEVCLGHDFFQFYSQGTLQKFCQLLNYLTMGYEKVLFLRFHIRLPGADSPNTNKEKILSLFRTLEHVFPEGDIHFAWTKKESEGNYQVYQCILLMAGNELQDYHQVIYHIRAIWCWLLQINSETINHYVDYCTSRCNENSDDPNENGICLQRLSSELTKDDFEIQRMAFVSHCNKCFQWLIHLII